MPDVGEGGARAMRIKYSLGREISDPDPARALTLAPDADENEQSGEVYTSQGFGGNVFGSSTSLLGQ